ncbi:MAG: hypothetical protein J2O48_08055, partial [Solirubrobacterales bacterium]|nr:hypothetical protein [Solirubrobacterales bacterium]
MTDGSFELSEFEHLEAVPGRALLRIAAKPTFDPAASALIVNGSERIKPLPAPPGPRGQVRIAFSLPAQLADGATAYALDLGDGQTEELPKPKRREADRILPPLPSPEPDASTTLPESGDSEQLAELQKRLEEERNRRMSADTAAATSAAARSANEQRLKSLDGELASAREQLETNKRDLESARNDLRSAQGEAELGATRANHARAEADAAEATLLQRQAEIELLRHTVQEADTQAQRSYQYWEQITAELTAEIEVARQVAANFQQHARNLQAELADSKLELTSLRALREAHEQAVADGTAESGDSGDPQVVA